MLFAVVVTPIRGRSIVPPRHVEQEIKVSERHCLMTMLEPPIADGHYAIGLVRMSSILSLYRDSRRRGIHFCEASGAARVVMRETSIADGFHLVSDALKPERISGAEVRYPERNLRDQSIARLGPARSSSLLILRNISVRCSCPLHFFCSPHR